MLRAPDAQGQWKVLRAGQRRPGGDSNVRSDLTAVGWAVQDCSPGDPSRGHGPAVPGACGTVSGAGGRPSAGLSRRRSRAPARWRPGWDVLPMFVAVREGHGGFDLPNLFFDVAQLSMREDGVFDAEAEVVDVAAEDVESVDELAYLFGGQLVIDVVEVPGLGVVAGRRVGGRHGS
jgi:hypothetical protein